MRLVRARDLVRRPWKNGGGTTAEIAVYPPDADLDGFDWRLSMADVASNGPFSVFPGVDRTLTLIDGNGLDLVIDGEWRRLDPDHPTCGFPGEAPTTAHLHQGPIRDFNVMTRRSRLRHSVVAAEPGRHDRVAALLALDSPTAVLAEARTLVLERFDALLFGPRSGAIDANGRSPDRPDGAYLTRSLGCAPGMRSAPVSASIGHIEQLARSTLRKTSKQPAKICLEFTADCCR